MKPRGRRCIAPLPFRWHAGRRCTRRGNSLSGIGPGGVLRTAAAAFRSLGSVSDLITWGTERTGCLRSCPRRDSSELSTGLSFGGRGWWTCARNTRTTARRFFWNSSCGPTGPCLSITVTCSAVPMAGNSPISALRVIWTRGFIRCSMRICVYVWTVCYIQKRRPSGRKSRQFPTNGNPNRVCGPLLTACRPFPPLAR